MTFRKAARRLCAAVLGMALATLAAPPVATAQAKVYTFKFAGKPFPITIPNSWTVKTLDDGIEVRTDEDDAIFWIQSGGMKQIDKMMAEYMDYFPSQGVTFTGKGVTSSVDAKGTQISVLKIPAQYKRKPTVIQLAVLERADRKPILFGYWAETVEADKAIEADIQKILVDLTAP